MCSNSVLCSVVFILLTRSDNIVLRGHLDFLGKIFWEFQFLVILRRTNKPPRSDNSKIAYGWDHLLPVY